MLWAFGPGSGETLSRPVIDQVAPRNGDSGEQISTTAYLDFGSAPFTYSWDFGGGATPNTSTEASPLITLGAIGSYSASVVVSNAWGTDSLDFTLVVKDPNAPPEWVSHKIDLFGALTGGFASAGSVNGKPAFFAVKLNSPDPILYYYESSVAEPALDIDWSRETVLDRAYTDKHVSMQVFDGEPAVAYVYDAQTLRYTVRNGGTWEHQDILTGNYFGKNLSMATVNGLPAIAFGNYDSAQWRLGYARSDSLSPASPADWQTSYFTSCNIDGGSLSLADNAGKPDVAFITRDVSDVFHVTYVHGLSSAPTGNADWLLHYVYSGINYRDKFVFSQYAGKPQLAFTLHGTDDDLLYAGATLAAPGSSADWNIHTLHSGGQILPVRVYAGSDNNWPVLCWTDDSASPVGYSNANVPQPLQAADWDTAQYPLGIIVLAAMEVNGNPVLIGLTEPERELRYYCYK